MEIAILFVIVILAISGFVYKSHINHKNQMNLISVSMREAINNMNKQNTTLFNKFEQRIAALEQLTASQQYEINRLKHTVNVQSHIINSVSPRIKLKPQGKDAVSY